MLAGEGKKAAHQQILRTQAIGRKAGMRTDWNWSWSTWHHSLLWITKNKVKKANQPDRRLKKLQNCKLANFHESPKRAECWLSTPASQSVCCCSGYRGRCGWCGAGMARWASWGRRLWSSVDLFVLLFELIDSLSLISLSFSYILFSFALVLVDCQFADLEFLQSTIWLVWFLKLVLCNPSNTSKEAIGQFADNLEFFQSTWPGWFALLPLLFVI